MILAIDQLTKWIEAKAVPDKSAQTIATFVMEDIISRHSAPKILQSDQGTEFVNHILNRICEMTAIKRITTSLYHPQANGTVERANQTILNKLRKLCDGYETRWDTFLPAVLMTYCLSEHSVIGLSPFKALYGRDAFIISEASKYDRTVRDIYVD